MREWQEVFSAASELKSTKTKECAANDDATDGSGLDAMRCATWDAMPSLSFLGLALFQLVFHSLFLKGINNSRGIISAAACTFDAETHTAEWQST